MKNDLNELSKQVFNNAHKKGFWDEHNTIMDKLAHYENLPNDDAPKLTTKEIEAIKYAFSCQRMMLIISELGEAVEAKRTGKKGDWDSYQKVLHEKSVSFDKDAFKEYIKDCPEDEIADALIRILDMTGGEGINIGKHVEHKAAYNSTRPRLHGKDF